MNVNKRPQSNRGPLLVKRNRRTDDYNDFFESQDIWKNLNKIRKYNKKADSPLKNSRIFIRVAPNMDINNLKGCIEALTEYVDPQKLFLQRSKSPHLPSHIVLQNFSVLDGCLVLSVLLSLKDKGWGSKVNKDYYKIPRESIIGGSIYLPKNCILRDSSFQKRFNRHPGFQMSESKYNVISTFKEVRISLQKNSSLSHFIFGVASFLSTLAFGKGNKNMNRQFEIASNGFGKRQNAFLNEIPFVNEVLFDIDLLMKTNRTIVEESNKQLQEHVRTLHKFNEASVEATTDSIKPVTASQKSASNRTTSSSRYDNVNSIPSSRERTPLASASAQGNKPGYLTQEQIKDHCSATIKASTELVKTKSAYQIFKVYVKYPKQTYIEKIFERLDELRCKTNCNIVVLNLNNLYESEPWFKALDISKYTTVTQAPHPSTVRVVSIGGVSEYIVQALDLIAKMLDS
ncbi:hypothetical protein KAFR_0E02790 [Kazachstania africana CBS 2517]|uniref:Uncharacterized protein n=1 Tax=Kazachstania africana (strain ATCC 22294 / BCRC 22015 / CBS 2517 / CECT 1963 / NBRC 1671 / NRRL Y-8276) TaxID=1071382 RepID=H2AVN1_KAZAF|nr:hypothetical protein KAFR_0E02790 [Kazachstania africana CBS 2517]CCF58431.1 hypothetical protein KAFR_0E02790 [Kazachstania africana CBS 2517]